jgi:hypothetical protein
VSSTIRIEHFVRLRLGADRVVRLSSDVIPEGAYVDLFKGSHRRTGVPLALAYDHRGDNVDPEVLEADIARRARKHGKVHPTLARILEGPRRARALPIAIWLAGAPQDEPAERPERLNRKMRAAFDAEAKRLTEWTRDRASRLQKLDLEVTGVSTTAPVVFAVASSDMIQRLVRRRDVAGLFFYDSEGIDDLQDSLEIHHSDDTIAQGATGSGVKVAVWENHPTSTANLDIDDQYLSTGLTTSDHAQNVTGIIKNTDAGSANGHAPDASVHAANDKDIAAVDWAIGDKRCRVLNQSFHRTAEATDGVMSFDDIYKDYLALRYPWPLFVEAAGNYFDDDSETTPPDAEYVNHKGYNTIKVGNHNDDASAMNTSSSVFSVFRNPTTPHGDRELPEIAANGSGVSATGLTYTGTSQAAPAVAGMGAQLHSTNSALPTWPEGVRAILLAAARRNVIGGTWWQDVIGNNDARDGSGSAHSLEGHRIAKSRQSKNNDATRRGWNAGLLTSSNFTSWTRYANFDYRVRVPRSFFGPRTVKVALTWTSDIDTDAGSPVSSTLAVDLDLHIVDSSGALVAYSSSWDNSYEIAEFVGKPGQDYRIRIRRYSGTEPTYHGIAWTVTGGFWDWFFLQQLSVAELQRVDLVDLFG